MSTENSPLFAVRVEPVVSLLPCPFCGGEARPNTMRTSDKEMIRLNGRDTFHGVNCVMCGADTRGLLGSATPEQAAERWNRRAS
jgi:hypothetical protein